MKFFKRDWEDLDDAKRAALLEGYRLHLEGLKDEMPESVRQLAGVRFQDGRVERFDATTSGEVKMDTVVGDLQVGYRAVFVRYYGAVLGGLTAEGVAAVLNNDETEIVDSELDRLEDGRWLHSFVLFPEGEFEIAFSSAAVEVARRVHRGPRKRQLLQD